MFDLPYLFTAQLRWEEGEDMAILGSYAHARLYFEYTLGRRIEIKYFVQLAKQLPHLDLPHQLKAVGKAIAASHNLKPACALLRFLLTKYIQQLV